MTRTGRVGIGFIGAGMISEQYLANLTTFPDVEVVRIGDIDTERAAASAAKWGVAASGTGADVLADPDVEIVINLTLPATHVAVSTDALRAGKHVWSEKPIGVDRASAASLVALADSLGLKLGIAPDTVLGPGWQTAKRAIEAGAIGTPLTAVTSMQWQGPDVFHPNASFLYAKGAGPLFDIGPYYFTALVHLLGPIDSVVATGSKSRETRQLVVGPNAGDSFPVEVPTHVSVLTSFEQGGSAQSLLSFDTPLFRHGVFEVNGTEGTIVLPDPNTFGGGHPIRIARPLTKDATFPFSQEFDVLLDEEPTVGRGLGVLDMARAIRGGGSHIATGEVGYHVLDTMVAVEESIAARSFIEVESTVAPVASLPEDFDPFASTLETVSA
ncbi:Gfo/Idh/MocA family protein [Curtobacterium sp. PhB115]|uniref:Gfo/Idh/MocA family protein n=1 Tax=Curtobacterium sp. PhB115 TaxID=2485173 RepID=UPI000F4B8A53|nr:Gfo/Idh/MocA family oxidoreductase [Curtobacterium sp. PhB115]ROP61460.1 putative dehydrogenase [Curtobacterium sp. PhB115]